MNGAVYQNVSPLSVLTVKLRQTGPQTASMAVSVSRAMILVLTAFALLWSFNASAKAAPDSFADLAEKLLPAVVNVSTTQIAEEPEPGQGPEMFQVPPGSPFEEFFRQFQERMKPNKPRRGTSLGSGFIIDPSGYIVTNNHVIADADEINVILQDETQLKAEIVGRDVKTDLALLKVESKKPLPYVPFGDSDKIRVGDWVIAIGNPFGLGGTVTAGIISARARDINSGPYDDYLQTDASINRGNSGGPLFNMKGEVVGVNTAIFSPTGGSIGIGFSVPASLAKPVLAQLKEFGQTRRGWLGVRIQPVTDEIAESLGLKKPRGALIAKVNKGEPAEKAGMKAGDIILKFDNRPVANVRKLQRIVAEASINKSVKVTVWRDEKLVDLEVNVGELEAYEDEPKTTAKAEAPLKNGNKKTIESVGLTLMPLSDPLRERFAIDADTKGVLIVEVAPDGNAAEKGLRVGDVITEVGQEEVSSPDEVEKKIDKEIKSGRKSVLLLVQRNGDLRFIPLRVAEE